MRSRVLGLFPPLATLIATMLPPAGASAEVLFSPTAALNTNAAADSGPDSNPQVAADGAGN